jgi:hypothetical protein
LRDDCTGDCQHFGIDRAVKAGGLGRPNLVGSAHRGKHHPTVAWLDHNHSLAPAHRKMPNTDNTRVGHRRADHPDRPDGHLAIRIEVIGAIQVHWVDFAAGDKRPQIDDLGAL